MKLPEPKFRIGEYVTKQFNAQVEGIPVTVTKRLIITGVRVSQPSSNTFEVVYEAREKFEAGFLQGKKYEGIDESSLIPVEAVVTAIMEAQP